MTPNFDTLLDDYMREHFTEFPTAASGAGIDGYDDKLADLSVAGFARRNERTDHWYATFSALSDEELSFDERIDRDLILSALRGSQISRDWEVWRRQPSTYLDQALNGVFILYLYRLHPDPELAESAAARMRQAPRILAEGTANLDPDLVPPIFAERAIGACRSALRYFRELVPAHASGAHEQALLADAGAIAAQAYEDFLRTLERIAEGAHASYAIGEERYSALLKEKEMLGFDARELRERGREEYERIASEMRALSQQIKGTDDFISVVEELNQDHPATPDAMRATYEEWTQRARQFLIDRSLVTLPDGEVCLVEPSPHFQRPIMAVASYYNPPPFKPSLTGHFMVPYPPDDCPPEEIQKRLESNSYVSIPTTAVHEAYPGHHWHLVTAGLNPRPARKLHHTSYFSEGWALYTEVMMRDAGFYDDPRHLLGVADARIFRAARIVVDTSLHIGDMTYEEGVTFMREKAGLSEPTARAEVGRYCSWPTQASSYLTGSLEIERMQRRWLGEKRGDLRAFHDRLASTGSLPLGLAERALFDAN